MCVFFNWRFAPSRTNPMERQINIGYKTIQTLKIQLKPTIKPELLNEQNKPIIPFIYSLICVTLFSIGAGELSYYAFINVA